MIIDELWEGNLMKKKSEEVGCANHDHTVSHQILTIQLSALVGDCRATYLKAAHGSLRTKRWSVMAARYVEPLAALKAAAAVLPTKGAAAGVAAIALSIAEVIHQFWLAQNLKFVYRPSMSVYVHNSIAETSSCTIGFQERNR
jgi:hypothetical protein